MFFRRAGDERVHSILASWTDVEGEDPWLVVAAGRAHFRVDDLLTLARLVGDRAAREGVK